MCVCVCAYPSELEIARREQIASFSESFAHISCVTLYMC